MEGLSSTACPVASPTSTFWLGELTSGESVLPLDLLMLKVCCVS